MYDDKSPQMNVPEIPIADDPHGVLNQIADTDREINRLRKQRERLLGAYEGHMKGIQDHWNLVIEGPPEAPMKEEIHTFDEYQRENRVKGRW